MKKLKYTLFVLIMLSWCPVVGADDGIVVKFNGGSSSSITVPVDGKIYFTSEGVKAPSTSTVKAFADFNSITFSPDRSAIQTTASGTITPSSPQTASTITIPATHSAVKVLGQSEPEPEPELIDISGCSIIITGTYPYTGSAITPVFRVEYGSTVLSAGTDYTSIISNNVNPGIAKVTITGKGNYTGTKSASFFIDKISLGTAVISGVSEQYNYTGSAIEPTFSVKHGSTELTAGTDYNFEYSNNKQPGTATITVIGTGNYNGTVTKQFEIVQVKNVEFTVVIDNGKIADPTETDDILAYNADRGTVYLAGTKGDVGDTVTIIARPNTGYEMFVKNFLCILTDGKINHDIDTMKTTIIDDVFTTKFLMPTTGTVFMMFEFKEKLVSAIDGIETCDDAIYQVFDARGMLVATGRKQDGEEIEELLAPLADGLYIIKVNNKTYKIYKR